MAKQCELKEMMDIRRTGKVPPSFTLNPHPPLLPVALSSSVVSRPRSYYVFSPALNDNSTATSSVSVGGAATSTGPLNSIHQDIIQRSFDVFSELDKNKDHRLGLDDLEHAVNMFSSSLAISREETQQILRIASKTYPDALTFSEFHNVYACMNILSRLQITNFSHLRMKDLKRSLREVGINPTQQQIDQMFALGDKYKTYDRIGKIEFVEFLKIYLQTPQNPHEVFLHSWYSVGRNATPYNKPVEVSAIHDFLAGTAAGIALTLVGHPFDTVKVRLQTERKFRSGIDCCLQTVRQEGPLALYKGMGGPMATIPLVNAIVFAAYGQAKDFLHKLQKTPAPLSLGEITLCGAYAGLVNCLVVTPVELVKTRLQIQYDNPHTIVVKDIVPFTSMQTSATIVDSAQASVIENSNNTTKASTVSHSAANSTSSASVPKPSASSSSNSVTSTLSMNSLKSTPIISHSARMSSPHHTHHPFSSLSSMPTPLVRGGGGVAFELRPGGQPLFRGPLDCVAYILQQRGLKGLFRGMTATVYREIPGYGGQFFLYEALKRALTKEGEKVGDLPASALIVAGGTAGLFGWMLSYPMDLVKSQLQAEHWSKPSPYKVNRALMDGGFFDCWRQNVKEHGWRSLWRGFGPCAARAFPANAVGFIAYETSLKFLRTVDSSDLPDDK